MTEDIANTDRDVLGQAMRLLRERAQLTQRQLATRAGADDTYISRLEHGRIDIGWSTLRRLLAALNADLFTLAEVIAEIEHRQAPPR
jgi:transcriptional regulator with XRE-family HTH domain